MSSRGDGYYVCQATVGLLEHHRSFLDSLAHKFKVTIEDCTDGEIRVGPFGKSDRARKALVEYQQWLTQEPVLQDWPAYVG